MTFTRSTDYAAIHALLTEPRVWRRMRGDVGPPRMLDVGPREGLEYVLATEHGKPVAVFVILQGIEVHFAFSPGAWGSTLETSKAFLDWAWKHLDTPVLVGPIPKHNRLALSLARRCGFTEHCIKDGLVYTVLERAAA